MSLGAIDFGLIVDGAVVLVENVVRRLAEPEGRDKTVRQLTAEAAHEVVRPIAFGIGIIILVYLPILSLGGIEGKMFKPMAWTVVFALVGSLLLTLTLTPVLASLFLEEERARPRAALRREGSARGTSAVSRSAWSGAARSLAGAAAVMVAGRRGRADARRRVHPAARRGRHLHQRRAARLRRHLGGRGEHRADRARPQEVPGGDHGRQPLGQPGAGHRRDGDRARRRVRDPEATSPSGRRPGRRASWSRRWSTRSARPCREWASPSPNPSRCASTS